VSLAESCTGGYVSSLLTAIPGASDVFKGAIVPYTNKAKHELLQVDEDIFTSVGAVSQECVEQLAQQVLKVFDSDYSIAISGIAGPTGGTPEKPVGTVWVAIASKEDVRAVKLQFGDHRQRNITMTGNSALNMLRKLLLEK
jgi:nicotinamide-nucleotide amidase